MKKRVVVWALLVSILGNTISFSLYAADGGPSPLKTAGGMLAKGVVAPFKAVDWGASKLSDALIAGVAGPVGKFNNCVAVLSGKLPRPVQTGLDIAGHVIPIIPTMKTLGDRDRLFFVGIESPLIGAVTTPVSSAVANVISGRAPFLGDYGKFFDQTVEIYESYQGTQAIRNGIATNPRFSQRTKLFLNWYYSTLVYGIRTAYPQFAAAHTPQQVEYAASLILYSALWPLGSQQVGNWLAMHLFSRFPNATLLKKIRDPNVRSEDLIAEQAAKTQKAREFLFDLEHGAEGVSPKELKKAKSDLAAAESVERWVRFFRTSAAKTADGAPVTSYFDDGGNDFKKRARYWGTKTSISMGVAVFMTTAYFLLRWLLVGRSADDDGGIRGILRVFMSQNDETRAPSEKEFEGGVRAVRSLFEEMRAHPEWFQQIADQQEDALAG